MRKLLATICMMGLTAMPAAAQDVLNEIVKSSLSIVNDTTQAMEVRKVAIFKYDAMTYLRSKVMQPADLLSKDVNLSQVNDDVKMLNEQAYAMNQYVDLFLKRMAETKKKNRYVVNNLFKETTYDNRKFNDPDAELTMAYYLRDDYPIQFCLDCDWVKALEHIRTFDWSRVGK